MVNNGEILYGISPFCFAAFVMHSNKKLAF